MYCILWLLVVFLLFEAYECIDVEKMDDGEEEEEDPKSELACPFCKEGFTALELCCHIYDDHDSDTNSGVFITFILSNCVN